MGVGECENCDNILCYKYSIEFKKTYVRLCKDCYEKLKDTPIGELVDIDESRED